MTVGIAFTFCSFFFIALLTVVYFSKPRLKLLENKIYSWLIVTSLFGTVIGLPCYYFMVDYERTPLPNFIFSRLYLIYLITWIMLFTLYVVVISFPKINMKKMNPVFLISYVVLIFLASTLPLYYHTGVVYSYGPATQYITVISLVFILIMLFCLFKNIKQVKQKKYLPLFFFILFGSVILTIQRLNPGLLLITFGEAFVTFLMYFTIENPDVKIINELNKNRLLINQITEEKSNFTFSISSQLKGPIQRIIELSSPDQKSENIKNNLIEINNDAHTLAFLSNSIMDVATLTNSNIKPISNKYNLRNLVEKIKIIKEKELKPNVDFRVNINNIIPEYLFGDSTLLEQVLLSLLDNAIKYTTSGFVELTINAIVKYDMCRLVITVSDSGSGMGIEKVNRLLLVDEPLTEEDKKRIETKNVDINTVKKIVNKLGGFFTIRSEENKGTEIKFVIDQKIMEEEAISLDKYLNKNTILVASNDVEFLNDITKILNKKGRDVETSISGNDIIDRIRVGQEFSYILIDDMLDIRAYEILKKLKKNPKFKIPVIVMLDKDTEFIKEHFIEDGFSDYLLKSNLNEEINRLFK